jgi:hypothetical protein
MTQNQYFESLENQVAENFDNFEKFETPGNFVNQECSENFDGLT